MTRLMLLLSNLYQKRSNISFCDFQNFVGENIKNIGFLPFCGEETFKGGQSATCTLNSHSGLFSLKKF